MKTYLQNLYAQFTYRRAFIITLFSCLFLVVNIFLIVPKPINVSEHVDVLLVDNIILKQKNIRMRYILDLATEFSIDPLVVELVDHYSREYVKSEELEWRLIRNPEFMTYIMLSLINVESRGDPNAVGDNGRAIGLTQLWVTTAQQHQKGITAALLKQPGVNIDIAFKHFYYLLESYKGNLALTLYGWNRGERRVDNLIALGKSPVNGYAAKVYQGAINNNRNQDWSSNN